jgi:glutamyl-tRNA synthetase
MRPTPPVITRFAPSPTGHLHVGGARTALFCWAFAKRYGGHFVLRIEDTDQARSSDDSARGIMEDLAWLGIEWDEGPELRYDQRTIGGDPRGVGPFFQARRVALYNSFIEKLVETGRAYPAFESGEAIEAERKKAVAAKQTYRYNRASYHAVPDVKERLRRMRSGEPHVVRLLAPGETIVVADQVLGDVSIPAGELDDFVLRKQDGFPTYHFAVVVDDETMGVTHVLRAQEHLINTPRHVALQRALGFRTPVYGHMPLIFNMDGTKMSKRDKAKAARKVLKDAVLKQPLSGIAKAMGVSEKVLGDFAAGENDALDTAEAIGRFFGIALPEIEVSDFREAGYTPEAITNFLALQGWNPGLKTQDGKDLEKFGNAFLGEHFSFERIGRTNSKFDRAKLLSFNGDAIAGMSDDVFAGRWRAWCETFSPALPARVQDPARWRVLAGAVKARAKTYRDGVKASAFAMLGDHAIEFDQAAAQKHLLDRDRAGLGVLQELIPRLSSLAAFEPGAINAVIEQLAHQRGEGMGSVAQPVRVAITGGTVSPPLGETLAVLGRESTLKRLSRCVEKFAV